MEQQRLFFGGDFFFFWSFAGAPDWEEAQVLGRQDVRGLLVHSLLQPEGSAGQAGDVEGQVHRVVSPPTVISRNTLQISII